MSDNRGSPLSCRGQGERETVCIDTLRVLDSCRDRDCYENVRVYLSEYGQDIIERTNSVRTKSARILWTFVGVDPVRFNCGFYQVTVRFYIKVDLEACLGIGRSQEFSGIAVVEKKVVLYGSVGNVSIYRSDPAIGPCDVGNSENYTTNLPIGVVEVVDPVLLSATVVEPTAPCCCCVCGCNDIPESVASSIPGSLVERDGDNRLVATLGIFSVIRIERPAQYLISAQEYSVPDKECASNDEDDPCSLFRRMAFPIKEFSPPSLAELSGCDCDNSTAGNGCGCGRSR